MRTRWYDPSGRERSNRADRPIDWTRSDFDGNGTVDDDIGVQVAVNGAFCVRAGEDGQLTTLADGDSHDTLVNGRITGGPDLVCDTAAEPGDEQVVSVGTAQRLLDGHDDWSNLSLVADPAQAADPPAELTVEEAEIIERAHDQDVHPDRRVVLNTPRNGFRAPVRDVAVDDRYVYATHFYESVDPPNASDRPGSLVVLDRDTLRVLARVPVGFEPHAIAVNPVMGRIYVLNNGRPGGAHDGRRDRHRRQSLSIVTTITVNTGQAAADIAVNSRTNRLYISNTSQDRIEVLDATTNTVLTPIPIGPGPIGMAMDETTNTLYVAQTDRSNLPPVAALGSVTDDGNTQQTHAELGPRPHATDRRDRRRPERPDLHW